MSELDKFKRRLIRSVARLLLHEKLPEEVVWEQLQKETGCDCQLLWNRMRVLTIKKLNRLLLANDLSKHVASVARLSQTDWLLFDLVLVHERIDVVGQDSKRGQTDPQQLWELFGLIQKHSIETVPSSKLVDAWANLVANYNTKERYCSPMLLQKRWYQLKEVTRATFYQLWNTYRGNQKLWEAARQNAPSILQMAIAKKFPHVITKPFSEWENMVEEGLVIMPQQFQDKIRQPGMTCDGNPDLVMIEPEIETIDLRLDSDSDEVTRDESNSSDSSKIILQNEDCIDLDKEVKIKQELPDFQDGLSNVQILATTHVPESVLDEFSNSKDRLSPTTVQAEKVLRKQTLATQMSEFMEATETFEEPIDSENFSNTDNEIEETDLLIKEKVDEYLRSRSKATDKNEAVSAEMISGDSNDEFLINKEAFINDNQAEESINRKSNVISINDENIHHTEIDDLIQAKAVEYCKKIESKAKAKADEFINKKAFKPKPNVESPELECIEASDEDDIIKQKADDFIRKTDIKKLVTNIVKEFELPADVDIVDEGIEFIDDGIEYIEEDDGCAVNIDREQNEKETKSTNDVDMKSINNDGAGKVDQKLLMVPVVYTTKLEVMSVFANKAINSVKTEYIIEEVLVQSKPSLLTSKKAVEDKQKEMNTPYTIEEISEVSEEKLSQGNETVENEPVAEDQKVKLTSHLFQKPRSRSYNPIQLCKNPDFNTRLKRLTVGFFTSTRNRQLLKDCMPLTIDLHKAFETKMIKGTLYLKSSDVHNAPVQLEEKSDDHSELATDMVHPSAMPIQSLIDATISGCVSKPKFVKPINTIDLTSKCDEDVAERNKVINLPNLSEIRRINQRLLTAEVSPIRLDSDTQTPTLPLLQAASFDVQDAQQFIEECQNGHNNAVPGSSAQTEHFSTQSNDYQSILNDDSADSNLLVEKDSTYIGRFGRGRGRGRGCGRGRGAKRGNKWFPTWRPPTYYTPSKVPVPWNKPKKILPTNKPDDFLITIDTLNKMLNKINGSDLFVNPNVKNKKQIWVLEDGGNHEIVDENKEEERQDPQKEEELTRTIQNKFTVQKASTPPPDAKITKKPIKKPRENRRLRSRHYAKINYCCWCNEKLQKMNTKSRVRQKHMCVDTCVCCCRIELADALTARGSKRIDKLLVPIGGSIILSDDEDLSANSISAPSPFIRVVTVESLANRKDTTDLGIQVGDRDSQADSKQGEVNAAVDSILSTTTTHSNTNPSSDRRLHLTVHPLKLDDGDSICQVPVVANTESIPQVFTQNEATHILGTTPHSPSSDISPVSKKKVVVWPRNRKPPIVLKRPLVPIKAKKSNTFLNCNNTVVSNPKPLQEIGVNKEENVLHLSSHNIVKRPKQNPIYLGKNKILLSTVKMPRDTVIVEPPPLPLLPEMHTAVVSNSPLPRGVQLIVMPNGVISYTVEPGVTLTEEELLVIPNIISAVQQQIQSLSQEVQSAISIDNVNLVQDKTSENHSTFPENKQKSSQNSSESNPDPGVTVVADKSSNDQIVNVEGPTESRKESASMLKDSSEKDMDTSVQENTSLGSVVENNAKKNDIDVTMESVPCVSGSRNLLSDLMEMSGISAADTLPVFQEPVLQPSVVASDVMAAQQIPITTIAENCPSGVVDVDAIQTPLEVLPSVTPLTTVSQLSSVTPSAEVNLPELFPVLSLRELKYAVDHNALFFKLDLDTGTLVAINVAVKKNYKTKAAPITKAVIDLTDDADNETAITVSNIQNNDISYQVTSDDLSKIPDVASGVKPLKLFKAVRLIKPNDFTLQQKSTPSTIASSTKIRKRRFDKIKARIDLVDSDTPMEGECLLNDTDDKDSSNKDKTKMATKSVTSVTNDSDDTSDDEPLAVISKKMKKAQEGNISITEDGAEVSGEKEDGNRNTTEAMIADPVVKLTESTTGIQDKVLPEDKQEKIDTREDTFLVEVENDDSQEDCILGV